MRPIFVYGTLRTGRSNHWLMRELGATRIGDAFTAAPMSLWLDVASGIPYMSPEPRVRIAGELFTVSAAALPRLDEFEEHPAVYLRERIRVVLEGRSRSAFAYLFHGTVEGLRLIEGGDFAAEPDRPR